MSKYSEELVEKICSLIRADSYTIEEVCEIVGIAQSTYFAWKDTKPEFSDAIKKAQAQGMELYNFIAKKSLKKALQGYTVEETRTVYKDAGEDDEDGEPILRLKEKTTTSKYIPPHMTGIIFTILNCDPENWKNRQNIQAGGKSIEDLIPAYLRKRLGEMTSTDIANLIYKRAK